MNKAILMGRLTRDPDLKYTQNNTAVCSFGLAVNRRTKRDREPDADFFTVTCFGKTAEFTSKWFGKGMQVAVVGSVRLNLWTGKNGDQCAAIEVRCEDAYFADSKRKEGKSEECTEIIGDEDCPF